MEKAKETYLELYILNRFSIGLQAYADRLTQSGLGPTARRIIDVGCGPGQWSFAAASVSPKAEIWGIDPRRELIDYAEEYTHAHGYQRIHFETIDYTALRHRFPSGYFDVLMCNGVLMYLERDRAFEVFAYLLNPGGQIFLFYNHHIGYYIEKSLRALREGDIRGLYGYGLKALGVNLARRMLFGLHDGDTALRPAYLQRLALRHRIHLEEIPTALPSLYRDAFIGLPSVFSMRGYRI